MSQYQIAVIVGSLRKESFNRQLANAVIKLAPPEFSFTQPRIDDLPLYNEDDDPNPPESAKRLKSEISASHGLMVVGPDFGTAVVLVLTAAALFWVAGLQKKYLMIAGAAGIVLAIVAVAWKPYRVARIIGKLDPSFKVIDVVNPGGQIKTYVKQSLSSSDPTYQPRQSRIAVGSGGALGVGLMHGKQKLLYLPEAHTDYIYAVVGEELGLWGTTALLVGFFIILWRGMRLYFVAPDDFGRYLALGITICIFVQALMNISVVLDLGPSKGIPLPMISYGGSSLLSTLTSLGLLLSVSEHAG